MAAIPVGLIPLSSFLHVLTECISGSRLSVVGILDIARTLPRVDPAGGSYLPAIGSSSDPPGSASRFSATRHPGGDFNHRFHFPAEQVHEEGVAVCRPRCRLACGSVVWMVGGILCELQRRL